MHKEHHIDGVWVPSVTTITGSKPHPWLDKWKAKWGSKAVRKTACANAIGTAFHDAAERLSRMKDVDYPTNRRMARMLERFVGWMDDEGYKPKHTEYHVVSLKYWYAGTLDAVGTLVRYGNRLILIDYKTGKAIYEDMILQLAAYAQAYFEETGIKLKVGLIVHVSKVKPHHKLTMREFKLSKKALNQFLKLRRGFTGVCPEHGEACMRRAA